MVTDEERDYMYGEYAKDPRMKINVGIRRRLAPLLDNGRDEIELMTAILFSLPGSPVLYYGDEIAMGDNIYLGDRDGVRTPMQWTGDRNGGFSRADFAQLYAPPLMDPVYGFQAVNVEAQLRTPTSLLRWLHRFIALRKEHPVFGLGDYVPLRTENPRIFAHLRTYADDVIMCVHNVARTAQAVELDLSAYEGRYPVEMFGRSRFPRIGELPYLLTLAPRGFFWFILEKPRRESQRRQQRRGVRMTDARPRAAAPRRGRPARVRDRPALVRLEVQGGRALPRPGDDPADRAAARASRCSRSSSCPARTSCTSCRSARGPRTRRLPTGGVICTNEGMTIYDAMSDAETARQLDPDDRRGHRDRDRLRGPPSSGPRSTSKASPLPCPARSAPCARWAPSSPTPRSCSTRSTC